VSDIYISFRTFAKVVDIYDIRIKEKSS